MSNFSNLKQSLLSCAIKMQSHMEKLLDTNQYNSAILEAMSYSALASGKRIRPFLLFASADIFGMFKCCFGNRIYSCLFTNSRRFTSNG